MPALPTITTLQALLPSLKIWQQKIQPALGNVPVPRCPFNFRASGGPTGTTFVVLNWEQVSGTDGYEIQASSTGDFSTATTIATFKSPVATAYVDSTVTTGVQKWYRIRSTAGTLAKPQSVTSVWSAPVSNTSGSGTTSYNPINNNSGRGGWNPPSRGGGGHSTQ